MQLPGNFQREWPECVFLSSWLPMNLYPLMASYEVGRFSAGDVRLYSHVLMPLPFSHLKNECVEGTLITPCSTNNNTLVLFPPSPRPWWILLKLVPIFLSFFLLLFTYFPSSSTYFSIMLVLILKISHHAFIIHELINTVLIEAYGS